MTSLVVTDSDAAEVVVGSGDRAPPSRRRNTGYSSMSAPTSSGGGWHHRSGSSNVMSGISMSAAMIPTSGSRGSQRRGGYRSRSRGAGGSRYSSSVYRRPVSAYPSNSFSKIMDDDDYSDDLADIAISRKSPVAVTTTTTTPAPVVCSGNLTLFSKTYLRGESKLVSQDQSDLGDFSNKLVSLQVMNTEDQLRGSCSMCAGERLLLLARLHRAKLHR